MVVVLMVVMVIIVMAMIMAILAGDGDGDGYWWWWQDGWNDHEIFTPWWWVIMLWWHRMNTNLYGTTTIKASNQSRVQQPSSKKSRCWKSCWPQTASIQMRLAVGPPKLPLLPSTRRPTSSPIYVAWMCRNNKTKNSVMLHYVYIHSIAHSFCLQGYTAHCVDRVCK